MGKTRARTKANTKDSVAKINRSWLAHHPLPRPDASGDKETRGLVLVVGGALELPGAVLLSGIAALRAGAGKLQIATCHDIAPQIGTAVPEALVASLPQSAQGGIAADAAADIVRRADGADSVLVGPGMVGPEDVRAIVVQLLRDVTDPAIILDAAALEPLAQLTALTRAHEGRLILTPHAGEIASMLSLSKEAVSERPQEIAEHAAHTLGAIVVLKGAVTYVASPSHTTCCYTAGDVGLATSGSGDTLAGVIAGLAARGTDPFIAASWGVFLHGAAGNSLARKIGRIGFLARELLDEIPRVMERATERNT
ncbi:MAG: NAD(P)H-hydrate dehydratase [Gemmatimonadaceae bacterium]